MNVEGVDEEVVRVAKLLYEGWALRSAGSHSVWGCLPLTETEVWYELAAIALTEIRFSGGPPLDRTPSLEEMAVGSRDPVATIREMRHNVYGDFFAGHRNLGLLWRGMLQNWLGFEIPRLPSSLVLLMLTALKLNRLSIPTADVQTDSYLDGKAYLTMSEEAATLERKDDA